MSNLTDPSSSSSSSSQHDATNPAHVGSSNQNACDSGRSMTRKCSSCQSLNSPTEPHALTSSQPLDSLLLLDKLNILMPHLISLVQIIVFVWVASFVLPLIQPFFSPVFSAITTIVNIPGAAFRFGISSVSGFYNSASTVYGASRNLGMSLVNVTSSWLTWSEVNSTEVLPPSPPSVLPEEVVYTFLSKAADRTQSFFDTFHKLCSAHGLEGFLQETLLIFDKARKVGREAQIPNCGEVVKGMLSVHNSFTNVYPVLLRVRWAGLGFLEGYIGWLLYLQDRIEQLPAEDDEKYLPQWLAFIADIEDEFNATANDAIAFRNHIEVSFPLVLHARDLATNVTEVLDVHVETTLQARGPFKYLPDFVYALFRSNFIVLRIHEENFILLSSATLQIDTAHKSLMSLHMRLDQLITIAEEFQVRLRTTEKRAKAFTDPRIIREHFVRVVDNLVRKKDALVTELNSDKRSQLLDDDSH